MSPSHAPYPYQELEAFLGHAFINKALLEGALTHPSYTHRKGLSSFERLEFLGDRVLGCVIAEALYTTFETEEEGNLSHRLVDLVRKECIGEVVQTWPLHLYLRLSKSLKRTDLPLNVLADAGEAILGALFLDAGLLKTQEFILKYWTPYLNKTSQKNLRDAKSRLQEWAQAHGFSLPTYEILASEGPDHAPQFHVRVKVIKKTKPRWTEGWGPSRKQAEQTAAQLLLEHLSSEESVK
ncbi:MAG: ribonuclease III [Alphaproteobacteria bacterium 16-39-46]|nr:MAG: ribonuclease III [Alphaproteobacteria bacterium 16-39-46]OZA41358.1 MAG: ribonuclease III [Alphaproteobacteria bacterium 17-39-52]HQS84851.1 ribonuclease III [Alphaproteobacteria bacterium]HQS94610.1 ribonuclease III [Alphaproteobacteria bacterium]